MTLNCIELLEMLHACEELQEVKMPFKLSLILAKNIAILKQEELFYMERERDFANKYIETDETGAFIQQNENVFKIKRGLEQECAEARMALNQFETDVNLRMIPINLIENMEFTPAQIVALEKIIEEE